MSSREGEKNLLSGWPYVSVRFMRADRVKIICIYLFSTFRVLHKIYSGTPNI